MGWDTRRGLALGTGSAWVDSQKPRCTMLWLTTSGAAAADAGCCLVLGSRGSKAPADDDPLRRAVGHHHLLLLVLFQGGQRHHACRAQMEKSTGSVRGAGVGRYCCRCRRWLLQGGGGAHKVSGSRALTHARADGDARAHKAAQGDGGEGNTDVRHPRCLGVGAGVCRGGGGGALGAARLSAYAGGGPAVKRPGWKLLPAETVWREQHAGLEPGKPGGTPPAHCCFAGRGGGGNGSPGDKGVNTEGVEEGSKQSARAEPEI